MIRALRDEACERQWFERAGDDIAQRRVCDLVGVDPKTVRRERPPDHADIRKKMHETAGTSRRFG